MRTMKQNMEKAMDIVKQVVHREKRKREQSVSALALVPLVQHHEYVLLAPDFCWRVCRYI